MWPESHAPFTTALVTQALKQAQVAHLISLVSPHRIRAGPPMPRARKDPELCRKAGQEKGLAGIFCLLSF